MFAAIAALPPTAGKLYDPVTDLPAANRAGAALFDFNHTASQTIESGAIAQINDRFGNGFSALQSTAGSRPASSANGIGGLTTGYFDGSNDMLEATASMADVSRNVAALSLCVTANRVGGDSDGYVVRINGESGMPRLGVTYRASQSVIWYTRDDGDSTLFKSSSPRPSMSAISLNYATGDIAFAHDGTAVTESSGLSTGNTSNTASNRIAIGE
jgi:hypothetical protein